MGNILTFIKKLKESGYEEVDEKFGIFVDFEGNNLESEADGSDKELSTKIEEKLNSSYELLEFLKNYGAGGKQMIMEASSKPGDAEVQNEAWNKMVPLVYSLLDLKKMTDSLNEMVPEVLEKMWEVKTSRESLSLIDVFKKNMFLVIQLGKILDYDMRFDALKMSAPSIPNDISYVKRQFTIRSKNNTANIAEEYSEVLNIQNLEGLSMFYINPTPALNSIIAIITKFFENGETKDEPLDLIVSFCKVCIKILDSDIRSKFQKFGTIGMIHRIMVATTLLYDHLHADGVFVKESPISIKLVVDLLEDEAGIRRKRTRSRGKSPPKPTDEDVPAGDRNSMHEVVEQSRNLLSVLKYSNKHLKSETTPKSVELMFSKIF
eukprot:GFUD01012288.1.p1 GENE.GFUD01012288.1~~GFUD01012288.1.p1  ORF type:complete len:393 (+),score=95.77 GFUD01012288.1:50-1180(+)